MKKYQFLSLLLVVSGIGFLLAAKFLESIFVGYETDWQAMQLVSALEICLGFFVGFWGAIQDRLEDR